MRRSLKRQISLMFIGLILFIVAMMCLINGKFLEQYYVKNKTYELKKMYEASKQAVKNESLQDEDTIDNLNSISERSNIAAIVMDIDGSVLYMTAREKNGLLFAQLMGYLLGENQNNGKVLESGKKYEVRRVTDPTNETEYIEMWGYINDSNLFILRSPMVSIQENAELANRFLLYMGGIALIIGSFIVEYFSGRITGPILELAELSKRMAKLDFNAKYISGGKNEIGVLGDNFNKMSETLENTISELKTANNELKKDIARKEESERMRTEFLGNVSHELKTPIALIQGYAEGLKEGVNEDPESREFYCDVIMDEATKMNQLVKNLLDLNQLEFGEDGVEFTRFDLTGLVAGVVQSCEILIQQADAKAVLVQKEPIYVWADEMKTEQVVRNYLTNAIHHVEDEKRIEIRMLQKEKVVRVSVFNSGKPIPEEDLDKLWDKFYKVDKAHTREYGGNGIGLSIVRAIMESLHQEYGVKNYDNGVEFWFELDTETKKE